ncbi:Glycosyltransferase family 28 C-terminal domain [Pristimantis euphronides]
MAGDKGHAVFLLFLLHFPLLQAAKILTICFVGGSHYLQMDAISRILHNNGHDVRMFLQYGHSMLPGRPLQQIPYPVSSYSLDENYVQKYKEVFAENQKDFFKGRDSLHNYLQFISELSYQCNITLHQSEILNFLKEEKYDLAILEAFNPCTFLTSEKLGVPYIAFFPSLFMNAGRVGMASPLSYVPAFNSHLTDHMDFFGRLKNIFMYVGSYIVDKKIDALFDNVIDEHFPEGSRPSIADLHLKAELWIYNIDFSIEFPRPLLPNVQYIGGLLTRPAKPLTQELEAFVADSGESGFIVVTLGSMISSFPLVDFLKEMNDGFAKLTQKIIWRYDKSSWPKEVNVAPNVRLMDWLSQNDLLGHPKARLLVTHGGMNSLMEAVYHGVPVLGIPLFGEQHENMVRIVAKNMGTLILPNEMKAEYFTDTMQEILHNSRYKTSAMKQSVIMRSRPFPPDQHLVRWVEHIIQSGGGGHLKPYSYQQPWYQQCLLDIILFISACLSVIIYLIVKVIRVLIHFTCSNRKQKQN